MFRHFFLLSLASISSMLGASSFPILEWNTPPPTYSRPPPHPHCVVVWQQRWQCRNVCWTTCCTYQSTETLNCCCAKPCRIHTAISLCCEKQVCKPSFSGHLRLPAANAHVKGKIRAKSTTVYLWDLVWQNNTLLLCHQYSHKVPGWLFWECTN